MPAASTGSSLGCITRRMTALRISTLRMRRHMTITSSNQITELLGNYGDIDILWFDGIYSYSILAILTSAGLAMKTELHRCRAGTSSIQLASPS